MTSRLTRLALASLVVLGGASLVARARAEGAPLPADDVAPDATSPAEEPAGSGDEGASSAPVTASGEPEDDARGATRPSSEPSDAPTLEDAGAEGAARDDAEGREAEEAEDEDDEDELPSYGVVATLDVAVPGPHPAAVSELHLDPAHYRLVPRRSAEELLTLAPGVFLVNHAGAFHASSVFLRGFDAGEGQDIELLVDGVPINEPSNAHGHGYADLHFVIPEVTRVVRVTEGPFAPSQGDFAVAGSVAYELGPRERGVTIQGSYGSFDRARLLLAWAPVQADPGTFVAVDLRDERGFGVQRAARSAVFNGRFESEVARGVRVSLFAAGESADFATAGVVRLDDVARGRLPCGPSRDEQFFCAADPNQGGSSSRALVDLGLTTRASGVATSHHLYAQYRRLRVRQNFTGLAFDPRGDGLDEQYEAVSVGARGRARFSTRAFDAPQVFELGYVLREDVGATRQRRLRFGSGVPYAAVFDDDLFLTQIGAHAGAELRFTDWLGLDLGVRADGFGLSAREKTFPEADRTGPRLSDDTTDAWGLSIAPRGSVHVQLAPILTWRTSVGVGTRSSDASALSTGERAPFARVLASETGLALDHEEGALHVDARALAFQTFVDRDLVFEPTAGRNVDVGASSRLGASAYLGVDLEPYLHAGVSFAWTEAFELGGRDFGLVSATRLPYVPRWVGRADVVGLYPLEVAGETIRVSLGVGASLLGERPLPLGQAADPVFLLDLALEASVRDLAIALAVTNATDARWPAAIYRYVSRWDPSEPLARVPALHASAGAPLAIELTLRLRFDETRGPFAAPVAEEPARAELDAAHTEAP